MCDRFTVERRDYLKVRFPRYDKPSSTLLKMYLDGEFGNDPDTVNAYAASSFFAVDRYASYLQDWRGYYESGGLVLMDRYTTSNALHQGAKLPAGNRNHFFKWLYEYEFVLLGLPRPGLVIYMDIEATQAAQRLKRRQTDTGTDGDIHEKDMEYLQQCVLCGKQAADLHQWKKVNCFADGKDRDANEIHQEIYTYIIDWISQT